MLNIEKYKEEILKYAGNKYSMMCLIYEDIMKKNDCTGYCSKCKRETIEWLTSEYKEPILTDEEKEYLSAVIKPFKNSIQYIGKFKLDDGFQQIRITYEGEHYASVIELPPFDNDMYKGMGIGKFYSLEELDLC